jgi:phosphohistidine phosphatase
VKTLLLLRHAKTERSNPSGDHGRRLTERGRGDAAAIARIIRSLDVTVDTIIASDAERARETAEIVAETLGSGNAITLNANLYGAGEADLLREVRALDSDANAALLIGHNPGLEDLLSILIETVATPEPLRTSGLAIIAFEVDDWQAVGPGRGRLVGRYLGRVDSAD